MKKVLAVVSFIGAICAIGTSAYAGSDFYIFIDNKTSETLTVQLKEDNCWYEEDFASPVQIAPGERRRMSTQAKNSGVCFFRKSEMTFKIFSGSKQYGEYYLRRIKKRGDNDAWGLRDNMTGYEFKGSGECFAIELR
jgi:hypothetical protein